VHKLVTKTLKQP